MNLFKDYDMSFCNNENCTYKTRCKRWVGHYKDLPSIYSCIMIEDYLSCNMFIDGKKEDNDE